MVEIKLEKLPRIGDEHEARRDETQKDKEEFKEGLIEITHILIV